MTNLKLILKVAVGTFTVGGIIMLGLVAYVG